MGIFKKQNLLQRKVSFYSLLFCLKRLFFNFFTFYSITKSLFRYYCKRIAVFCGRCRCPANLIAQVKTTGREKFKFTQIYQFFSANASAQPRTFKDNRILLSGCNVLLGGFVILLTATVTQNYLSKTRSRESGCNQNKVESKPFQPETTFHTSGHLQFKFFSIEPTWFSTASPTHGFTKSESGSSFHCHKILRQQLKLLYSIFIQEL